MNIAIAAMLFVAAFAGVALIADEDVAADASQEKAVTFKWTQMGGVDITVTKQTTNGGNFVFPAPEDVFAGYVPEEGKVFAGWEIMEGDSSTIYTVGPTYVLTSDIKVKPYEPAAPAKVILIYGDVRVECISNTPNADVSSADVEKFAKAIGARVANDAVVLEGYKTVGWFNETGVVSDLKFPDAGKTVEITLKLLKICDISFVADGVTIAKCKSTEPALPASPSKENFKFMGWNDGEKTYMFESLDDLKAYDFKGDTIFTAVFEPNTYKVYFMNGEAVVAERSSEYLGQIDLPALPENCTAWADKDGNVVGSPVTITGPDMRFYAVAEVVKCNVAFIAGEQTVATVEVVKGEKLSAEQIPALPEGAEKWDFDFEAPISEDVVIKSVAKVYDVTFDFGIMYAAMNVTIQVEHGQVIPADKVPAIPAEFPEKNKRWAYDADAPVVKDMTVKLRDNIYYTVTFIAGEQTVDTVSVLEKTVVAAPELPEGYKAWDFDFTAVITADTTIKAIAKENVFDVTFEIEGKTPVIQKSDSLVIPDPNVADKVFKGWVVKGQTQYVDPSTYAIKEDVTFVAIYDEAPAPAGPGFFETNEGKCVAVIIGVALLAFVYAVYTNMFGMKDFLTSIKIQRVKKE
jgi:hypothetical protein